MDEMKGDFMRKIIISVLIFSLLLTSVVYASNDNSSDELEKSIAFLDTLISQVHQMNYHLMHLRN